MSYLFANSLMVSSILLILNRISYSAIKEKSIKYIYVSVSILIAFVVYYITRIQIYTVIMTSTNERTHFFINIYLSHFILERVNVCCVSEMSW